LLHHARDGVEFVGRALERQFVVDLEQHGGLVPGRLQRRVDAHHGQLDENSPPCAPQSRARWGQQSGNSHSR
jgi:hypothetical protein